MRIEPRPQRRWVRPFAALSSGLRNLFRARRDEKPGNFWEGEAAEFLRKEGYRIIARNIRMRRGEIDIIADDGNEIVFVEVKQRGTLEFGGGEYAIGRKKRRRLLSAAKEYLARERLFDQPCRFDTVIINTGATPPDFSHTRDAFGDEVR
ncbi:MAG: YraN family protein [Planctomycetota bacterium]|jgi:putative endonuclease